MKFLVFLMIIAFISVTTRIWLVLLVVCSSLRSGNTNLLQGETVSELPFSVIWSNHQTPKQWLGIWHLYENFKLKQECEGEKAELIMKKKGFEKS